MPELQTTHNGIPASVTWHWSSCRNKYEVVLTLNPDCLPGWGRDHKTMFIEKTAWEKFLRGNYFPVGNHKG